MYCNDRPFLKSSQLVACMADTIDRFLCLHFEGTVTRAVILSACRELTLKREYRALQLYSIHR